MSWFKALLLLSIRLYQAVFSPLCAALFAPLGLGCRYQPTCSQYALEAIQGHGPFRGLRLAGRRLLRCHPWGGSGYDPVPPPPASPAQPQPTSPPTVCPADAGSAAPVDAVAHRHP